MPALNFASPLSLRGIRVSYAGSILLQKSKRKPPTKKTVNSESPHKQSAQEKCAVLDTLPSVPEIMPTPPPNKERYTCRPDQTPWWKTMLEVTAVVVGLAVAVIYVLQLKEMRKSTDASTVAANAAKNGFELNRDSLKATSAGIIVPNMGFQQGSGVVNVVMENRGKGNAWDIETTYRVSLISLPRKNVILRLPPKTAVYPVVAPADGPGEFTILPKYTREDLLCFNRQQEAVQVEGEFRYGNSFDNVGNRKFCLIAMVGNTIPCSALEMRLRVNSDPLGLNIPPIPPQEDCHKKE